MTKLLDRARERSVIDDFLRSTTANQINALWIEGESGVGKTSLFWHAVNKAGNSCVRFAGGHPFMRMRRDDTGLDAKIPLSILANAIQEGSVSADDDAVKRFQVLNEHGNAETLLSVLDTVADIAGLSAHLTPRWQKHTQHKKAAVSALNNKLVYHQALGMASELAAISLEKTADKEVCTIAIDDVIWADTLSISFLSDVIKRMSMGGRCVQLVLSCRTPDDHEGHTHLVQVEDLFRLHNNVKRTDLFVEKLDLANLQDVLRDSGTAYDQKTLRRLHAHTQGRFLDVRNTLRNFSVGDLREIEGLLDKPGDAGLDGDVAPEASLGENAELTAALIAVFCGFQGQLPQTSAVSIAVALMAAHGAPHSREDIECALDHWETSGLLERRGGLVAIHSIDLEMLEQRSDVSNIVGRFYQTLGNFLRDQDCLSDPAAQAGGASRLLYVLQKTGSSHLVEFVETVLNDPESPWRTLDFLNSAAHHLSSCAAAVPFSLCERLVAWAAQEGRPDIGQICLALLGDLKRVEHFRSFEALVGTLAIMRETGLVHKDQQELVLRVLALAHSMAGSAQEKMSVETLGWSLLEYFGEFETIRDAADCLTAESDRTKPDLANLQFWRCAGLAWFHGDLISKYEIARSWVPNLVSDPIERDIIDASFLDHIGLGHFHSGNLETSEQAFTECLRICRRHHIYLETPLNNLGAVCIARGKFDQAHEHLSAAGRILFKRRFQEISIRLNHSIALFFLGRTDEAIAMLGPYAENSSLSPDPVLHIGAQLNKGFFEFSRGHFIEATRLLKAPAEWNYRFRGDTRRAARLTLYRLAAARAGLIGGEHIGDLSNVDMEMRGTDPAKFPVHLDLNSMYV